MQATLSSTDELRANRGKRIQVTFRDGYTATGVLEGARDDVIYLTGFDGSIARDEISRVSLAMFHCVNCGREAIKLFDDYCATCSRERARRQPPVREPCARGDGQPGIREPGTDEFLCAQHHAEAGHHLRLTIGNSASLATCATEDASSPNHAWKQVRGARFRCVRCQVAEKYDPELLKSLREDLR